MGLKSAFWENESGRVSKELKFTRTYIIRNIVVGQTFNNQLRYIALTRNIIILPVLLWRLCALIWRNAGAFDHRKKSQLS